MDGYLLRVRHEQKQYFREEVVDECGNVTNHFEASAQLLQPNLENSEPAVRKGWLHAGTSECEQLVPQTAEG